jgi:hypothetical protein
MGSPGDSGLSRCASIRTSARDGGPRSRIWLGITLAVHYLTFSALLTYKAPPS